MTDATPKKPEPAAPCKDDSYHCLFENNHAVMLIIDPDNGNIIDANGAAQSFYGWSREDIVQKKISEINTLDEQEIFRKMKKAKKEQRNHFFFSHRLSNGEIRDVEVNSGPITLFGKQLLYSIVQDITERKQVEAALLFNQKQLEAVHDNINADIYITDIETHRILFMNRHMKEKTGMDLTGKTCWKAIHDNTDGPCAYCRTEELIGKDGDPSPPHTWEFHDAGTGRWYDNYNIAIPWMDGRLVRMQISTDITHRKQSEERQKNINEQLELKVKSRTAELEEMNTALKILLKKRDEDKREMEEKIHFTYDALISPFMAKVKASLENSQQRTLMNILESNLHELLKPFSSNKDPLLSLTPVENQIAAMVKQGFTNKEMAETLNKSIRTISNHRDHIRLKLGLRNKKVNLRSFLSSL